MGNQYAPPGESSFDLYNERSVLDGLFLGSVAYGVHLTLFIWCIHLLFRKKEKTKHDWFLAVYVTLIFVFGTVGNALNTKVGEVIWVDDRNFPGGPNAYYAQGGGPYNVACNIVYIMNLWFQDGMLFWRFWTFLARQNRWYLAILPGLMFLASIGISLVLIVMLARPGITLWSTMSVDLAIPYWSISIALNIIITAGITGRLLYMRYQGRRFGGQSPLEYIPMSSILVESAALYTSNALIFLVSYAVNSPIQNLAMAVLGQTQSIAPLLIVLRMLQGQAWSSATLSQFDDRVSELRLTEFSTNIPKLESGDSASITLNG